MAEEKFRSFAEFWPFYVGEHRSRLSRRLHVTGTSSAFVFLALAAVFEQPWFILCALVSGYALAWVGHFFVEHNRPATFKHPLWSLMGDFKMFALTMNGKMDAEIARLGLVSSDARAGGRSMGDAD